MNNLRTEPPASVVTAPVVPSPVSEFPRVDLAPDEPLFSLGLPPAGDGRPSFWRRLYDRSVPSLERLFGVDRINAVYSHCGGGAVDAVEFIGRCLDYLRVRCVVAPEDLARIPKSGPLVVVSNHPFGAIDGLMLGWALRKVRPDVKIMVNFLLARIPNLRELFFFVDPFGGDEAKARNSKPMRDSLRWLQNGGLLAAFPAGEVAHLDLKQREVTDCAWNPTIARIARRTGAPVLPVYFDGRNRAIFQILGLIHPRLRTAMLPREVFAKEGQKVEMRIGSVIPAKRLAEFGSDEEAVAYMRRRAFLLRHRPSAMAKTRRLANGKVVPAVQEPVIDAVDPESMVRELAALPADQLLVEHDDLLVYQARTPQIPQVMREIARLREITFRATGEGTGRGMDLDTFDADYFQMFIWNRATREIVGAYRLGPTDEILPRKGKAGLYTSTLFDYREQLLQELGPALEMGRSFVRPEYQRSFAPLLLPWKGIGAMLLRMPRYRMLFGPVSISNDYQSASRQIMVHFLQVHHLEGGLASLVRPRNPFPEQRVSEWDAASVKAMVRASDDLSEIVSEVEPDQKGIPILLKHYLKLGAKLLAVNLDPDFSDVVDGLILVDVPRIERRVLDKYMGKEGAETFRRRHGV